MLWLNKDKGGPSLLLGYILAPVIVSLKILPLPATKYERQWDSRNCMGIGLKQSWLQISILSLTIYVILCELLKFKFNFKDYIIKNKIYKVSSTIRVYKHSVNVYSFLSSCLHFFFHQVRWENNGEIWALKCIVLWKTVKIIAYIKVDYFKFILTDK